jgi:Xaa-Pro aminopeptidase
MFRRKGPSYFFAAMAASLSLSLSLPAQVPAAGYHGLRLPDAFFAGNRERLLQQLRIMGPGTLAIIKSMPEQPCNGDGEHAFRQDSDFYYLTGVEEPGAVALLSTDGDKPYTLLIRPRDPKREAWNGPRLGLEGALKKGADQAIELPKGDEALMEAIKKAQRVVLVCNLDREFRVRVLDAALPLGTDNGHGQFRKAVVDGRHLVAELRSIKQPAEIDMIQKAVDVSVQGHLAAMRASRTATNEGEVAGAFEGAVRMKGARFLGYGTIAGAGNQSCILHYPFNDAPLLPGELQLMDAGAEVGYYTADITRTWPANGKFSAEQRALYDLVFKAQEAGIAACAVGNPHIAAHYATSRVVSDGLVDLGILKGDKDGVYKRGDWKRFFIHGTGHWLGLDVHDAGDYGPKDPIYRAGGQRLLEAGMVLTVEPGIYIPKGSDGIDPKWQGIGIRIEDDILVTKEGPKNMSARLPRKAEEVERAMK